LKFQSRSQQSPTVELTPLIDVVFLLLIFFMITTTFVSRAGLQVQVPEADSTKPNPEQARVEVMVTEKGNYLVDGKDVPADADLGDALREKLGSNKESLLVIRADRNARHKAVVAAMDAGKNIGLTRIAISTVDPVGNAGQ